MKVTWVIENFAKEESFKGLTEAAEKLGYPLIKIEGDYSKDLLDSLKIPDYTLDSVWVNKKQCVIVNGTIKMCKMMAEELTHCSPVIYSNFPKYRCSAYYSHFGPYLFNDKYCLMSLKEMERQKFDVFGTYGKDGVLFIRPDDGDKPFQAGLLDVLDLGKFVENHSDCLHDLVLISTPKNIKWEGRFIVSKYKEIIAQSSYRFQGQVTKIPTVPVHAMKLCKEILDKIDYYPDSVFCLDLCEDNDGNPWLLELTSFSSAGLYAADKDKIVQRVSEIAWKEFNE